MSVVTPNIHWNADFSRPPMDTGGQSDYTRGWNNKFDLSTGDVFLSEGIPLVIPGKELNQQQQQRV